MALEATSGARTLMRGLALLELVAESPQGIGVSDLAAQTGLDRGTVSRLLATIRECGYVRQRPSDRKYSLSSKLTRLSQGYLLQTDITLAARPMLLKLRDEFGETVHLAVRDGTRTMYADQVESDHAVRAVSAIGLALPLHVTAMGRAILAAMAPDERALVLDLVRAEYMYDSFVRDGHRLDEELSAAQERGWATVDRGDDITRIGAAIVDGAGEPIASVSVSGPTYRMKPVQDRVGERLRDVAEEIAAAYNA